MLDDTQDNLGIWEAHADIDPKYTKSITGKDYKGTSPNAHYVIKCLTEMFGPVGAGFGWRVLCEDIERFGDTAIHWCRIEFWHTDRANTFEAYGQTKMAYMTRGQNAYLKVDEDAPKKSLTDAITKAAGQIGIAANIFLGRWDDNKHVEEVNAEYRAKENAERLTKPVDLSAIQSAETGKDLLAACIQLGGDAENESAMEAIAEKLRTIISKSDAKQLAVLESNFQPVWPLVASTASERAIQLGEDDPFGLDDHIPYAGAAE